MNGRQVFDSKIFLLVLELVRAVFRIFPRFLTMFVWTMISIGGGNLAVLLRYIILSVTVNSCGKNVYVGRYVVIKGASKISMGRNVSIHEYSYLDGSGGLKIGDDVSIAHGCSIITFDHQWNDRNTPIKYNSIKFGPVEIGNDVWVGCGVRILSGVRIGSRSIVAAGAVVTSDVPDNSIVAGVPAKVIKRI